MIDSGDLLEMKSRVARIDFPCVSWSVANGGREK